MVYSTRRFVVCLTLCHFVLVFFSPFSIAITSLGEERSNLSAFRMFDRFVFVWICRFPLPVGVWEGLRFVIVALLGLLFYLFFLHTTPVVFVLCGDSRKSPRTFNGVIISSASVCTLQSTFVFLLFLMILIYTSLKVRYLPVFVSRL